MAPRQQKPRVLTIDGVRRTVVHTSTSTWTEQALGGRLVHHVGRLLDGQSPTGQLEQPKPCTVCKTPTTFSTPRGRAVHPACEGYLEALPDALATQIIFGVAVDLGASLITSTPPSTKESRRAA